MSVKQQFKKPFPAHLSLDVTFTLYTAFSQPLLWYTLNAFFENEKSRSVHTLWKFIEVDIKGELVVLCVPIGGEQTAKAAQDAGCTVEFV